MSPGPVALEAAHTVVGQWISHPNIVLLETSAKTVGGHETGEQAIVVGVVRKKSPATMTALDFPVPPTVEVDVIEPDGSIRRTPVPTDVIETGLIRPLSSLDRWQRPCPGGFGISIPSQSSWLTPWNWRFLPVGTLGVTAFYRNKRCLLTNCHVIGDRSGRPGQPVYQPQPAVFELWSSNLIGVCDGTFEIKTYPSATQINPFRNVYDFAWCEVPEQLTSHAVYRIYAGSAPLEFDRHILDLEAMWIGAATGEVRDAKILDTHAISKTQHDDGTFAFWKDCLSLSGGMGGEGDSGAALLRKPLRDPSGKAVENPRILGLISQGSSPKKRPQKIIATRIPPDNGGSGQQMLPRILPV
jgi:hypothetical protein